MTTRRLGVRLAVAPGPTLVLALFLALVLTACGGNTTAAKDTRKPSKLPATAAVTQKQGARIGTPDGRLQVAVPAGAVTGPGELTVRAATGSGARAGWDISLAGTDLTGAATLSFELPKLRDGEPAPLIQSAPVPGGAYTTMDATRLVDGRLVVSTTHFSFWTIQTWSSVFAEAWKHVRDERDRVASQVTAGKQPRCDAESATRAAGYQIHSDSGRRVYWCLGTEAGKRVLKVVNARGYGVSVETKPGLTAIATDRKEYLDVAAEWFRPPPLARGDKVEVLPSGNQITYAITGGDPTAALIQPAGAGYLLSALQLAIEEYALLLGTLRTTTKFQAAIVKAVKLKGCGDALVGMATSNPRNAADVVGYFDDALSASFACVDEAAAGIADLGHDVGPITWVVHAIVGLLDAGNAMIDGLGDLNGYEIVITPPKDSPTTQVVIDPFTDTDLKSGWRLDTSESAATPLDCSFSTPSQNAIGPSTHRCGTTADSASACWAAPSTLTQIWCLDNSTPNSNVLRVLPAEGVSDLTPTPKDPMPIFLELSDGSQFFYRTGGAWGGRADGLIPVYGCVNTVGVCRMPSSPDVDQQTVLASDDGTFDRSSSTWRVRVGQISSSNGALPAPTTMAVSKAWFMAGHKWEHVYGD